MKGDPTLRDRGVRVTKPPVRRVLAAVACAAAIAATAACGSGGDDSQDPVAQAPATTAPAVDVTAPVAVGQKLMPGTATPDAVTRALASGDTVLLAFLANGPAEDGAVRVSLGRIHGARDVRKFVYDGAGHGAGDLVEALSVVETPTVAVVDGSGRISSRWVGLVDAEMMRQAIADAEAD
jgi:hypothetical protein